MLTRRKNRQGWLPRVVMLGVVAGALFVFYEQTLTPSDDLSTPEPTPTLVQAIITPTPLSTDLPSPTPLPLIGEPTATPLP